MWLAIYNLYTDSNEVIYSNGPLCYVSNESECDVTWYSNGRSRDNEFNFLMQAYGYIFMELLEWNEGIRLGPLQKLADWTARAALGL